jgi:hypothetical protein
MEYLRVKATAVSVRLRIYLCALIYTNSEQEVHLVDVAKVRSMDDAPRR